MGRGRAKAKQVKVARQLKYSGGGMDLDRLRAEFGVGTDQQDADDHDPYADFANRYSVDDDETDEDEDDLGDEDDIDLDDLDGDDYEDEEYEDDYADDDDLVGEDLDDGEDLVDPVRGQPRAEGGAGVRVNKANGS
jgi:Protein of unknown function (DUF3073)